MSLYCILLLCSTQIVGVRSHVDHYHQAERKKAAIGANYMLPATFSDKKLTSPNYPEPYSNNTNITWLIRTAYEGHITVLSIDVLDLAIGDTFTIYNGSNTSYIILAEFSGVSLTNVSSIYSTGNSVLLKLNSNNDDQTGQGFSLRYHGIDPDAIMLMAQRDKQILVSPEFNDTTLTRLSYMLMAKTVDYVVVVNFTSLNISKDDTISLYEDTPEEVHKIVDIYNETGKIIKSHGQHMCIQVIIKAQKWKEFELEYFLDTVNNGSYSQDVCFPSPCAVTHICNPRNKTYFCQCPENLMGPYCDIRCNKSPGDIAFLLDSSRSISPANWDKVLKFVVNVVRKLEVNDDVHRIGVISFNNNATINIQLDDYINNTESLVSQITTLPFMDGKTNISGAIRLMTDGLFNTSRGDREGVVNIGIIVTDGYSTIDGVLAITEASRAKYAENITLFAIGVGDKIEEAELNGLANQPYNRYSFKVDDFDALGYLKRAILLVACTKEDVPALVGKTGPTGATGPSGLGGDIGEPGLSGSKNGTSGEVGAIGSTGSVGEPGIPGVKGITGALGGTGYTGPKGPTGDTGLPNVIIGATGAVGERGIGGIGMNGNMGVYGATGSTGFKGEQGNPGNRGIIQGIIGMSGPIGPNGQQGIEGPQGSLGSTGEIGQQGLPGPLGPRGPPVVFSDGNQCTMNYVKQCDHVCVDLPVGYMCECEEGYILDVDKHSCIDINECKDWNGGCDQFCHNTEGSRFCTCGKGFTLSLDKQSCLDIDECCSGIIIPVCKTSELCVNTFGSYTCMSKKIAYYPTKYTTYKNETQSKSRLLKNDVFIGLMIWMGSLTVITVFTLAYILLSDDGPEFFNARSFQITPERYRRMTSKEAHDEYIFPRMNLGESSADNLDAGELNYRKSYASRAPVEKRKLSREERTNVRDYFDGADMGESSKRKSVVTIQEPPHI